MGTWANMAKPKMIAAGHVGGAVSPQGFHGDALVNA